MTQTTEQVRAFAIKRINPESSERVMDMVAAEEPLAIRVAHHFKDARRTENLAVTMRTPGHDRELAAGLLLAEGVIRGRENISEIRALGTEPSNEILVELAADVDFEAWRLARNGFVSSSCGVCGKRSGEAFLPDVPTVSPGEFHVGVETIQRWPDLLRAHQDGFAQTGGLHAAALVTASGEIEAVFEDIGRHNALDKLIGWSVWNGRTPLRDRILFLSSRSSFELIQKAAMAGAVILATVGGPSSLAIETARRHGITLIGFVREKRFNVYAGEWRVHS